MPTSKQKIGRLPSPALRVSAVSTPGDHVQLGRRCQPSSVRAALGFRNDFTVNSSAGCWEQHGAARPGRICSSGKLRALTSELVLSCICSTGQTRSKRFSYRTTKVDLNPHLESRQHRGQGELRCSVAIPTMLGHSLKAIIYD